MEYVVSPAPHRHSGVTTNVIMRDVLIALVPALIASVIFFGPRALLVVAVTTASAILFEYAYRRLMHLEQTVGDLSAAVTGVLLAFNLPVSVPLWIPIIGSFVAIVIVKQLFGGIGKNFANPAITARIVLMVSFAVHMTDWTEPFAYLSSSTDAVATATPLAVLASGEGTMPSILNLFLGNCGGCLGETSALALLIGGIYLVARKVIHPSTPIAYLATVAVLSIFGGVENMAINLFGGGLMIGAIFMATDYTTSPTTVKGKVVFGIGCGLITMLIRSFGSYPEGVSFSILLMNLLVPYIDRFTAPHPFGLEKEKKKKEKTEEEKPAVESGKEPIRPMRDILRPTAVICAVVIVLAGALAVTYQITYVPEEEGLTDEIVAELNEILPEATDWEELDWTPEVEDEDTEITLSAQSDSGLAFQIVTDSYGGDLTMLVVISSDGTIAGVSVTDSDDTPGLGSKAADSDFLDQYIGKSGTVEVQKNQATDDNDIVAVAGATISSKAVTAGVNAALDAFAQWEVQNG